MGTSALIRFIEYRPSSQKPVSTGNSTAATTSSNTTSTTASTATDAVIDYGAVQFHMDGHPCSTGKDLANFLDGMTIVNGLTTQTPFRAANGFGDLVLQYIHYAKESLAAERRKLQGLTGTQFPGALGNPLVGGCVAVPVSQLANALSYVDYVYTVRWHPEEQSGFWMDPLKGQLTVTMNENASDDNSGKAMTVTEFKNACIVKEA